MPIQDVALKTSQEQWAIETDGERGSGRSVLAAQHDDDDDDDEIELFLLDGNTLNYSTELKQMNDIQ